MRSDWRRTDVGSLIAAGVLTIGDGYRAKNEELSETGLPFARAGNINEGFNFEEADRFPVERLSVVGEKVSRPGDVVFTSKGTVGRFAFVTPNTERFVYSPQLCYWRSLKPDEINPRFLYYWMNSPEFLRQVGYMKGQTDMADYVSLRDQRRIEITLPDTDVQQTIVRILGSIDDKIQLNRKINTTLEYIAKVLFKSWFVDFDPVNANSHGNILEGLDAETASLFPKEFEETTPGEQIPKGWQVSTIGEEVEVLGGTTPSTKEPLFWEGGMHHWVTPRDLAQLSDKVLLDTDRKITDLGLQQISSGQLPVGTVLLSSRAPIGYLALAQIPVSINQGFIAMVCNKRLSKNYVLQWAEHAMSEIEARASGTTFAEISKSNFRPIPVLVPSSEVIRRFDDIVTPIYQQITEKVRENTTLSQLRDELLPKLISGKLRFEDLDV